MARLMPIVVISLLAVVGCGREMDIEEAPIGSQVQVTKQDGAVVDGTLAARTETTVELTTPGVSRAGVRKEIARKEIARKEIADVQVVTPEDPPELPPIAKFREFVVPDGTGLKIALATSSSSETSQVGDRVEAKLIDAERIDGVEVLPAGSVLHGVVSEATSAGKVKGRAKLGLRFETIVVGEARYPISAGISAEAPSTKGKDVATIGIPAIGGAVIGGILGGNKGAATGAAVGGGAGAAVVLATEGKPVLFGSGTEMTVTLMKDVVVRVPVR